MTVKGKVNHGSNVVNLFGNDALWFEHGFKKLAERVELEVDVLFMLMIELSVTGMIQPVGFEKPEGGLTLKFRVACDLREARELRRNVVVREKLTPETFEQIKGIRDGIFGPMPEDL